MNPKYNKTGEKKLIRLHGIVVMMFFVSFICPQYAICQTDNDVSYGWHTVAAGENLYRISQYYFLKESDITEVNPGLTAQNLKAGQKIKIPLTVRNKKLLVKTDEPQKIKTATQSVSDTKQPVRKSYAKNTHLNIAMFIPLRYEKVNELDFTKFNINEKRKKEYKSFEYITFYEGARIALDRLEKQGYNVTLYVYDVEEDDVEGMRRILNRKEMKDMNMLIPLVFRKSFEVCMDYAQREKIPLVNPMSPSMSILNNNQVFKIQPSAAAEVETIMRYIRSAFGKPNITVIHSNTPEEKPIVAYYKQLFEKDTNLKWTIIDYKKYANRITERITKNKDNIVISLVRKSPKEQDETYIKDLLAKLNLKKDCYITLFGSSEWIDMNTIDVTMLQQTNFHFLLSYLNDYSNANFIDFVKDYREHFKSEPDKIYASLGFDIISYFVPAMIECGDSFMDNPNITKQPQMINPFYFERADSEAGWQNKKTTIYKLNNYKITAIPSK
jgi:LysM repeat protein